MKTETGAGEVHERLTAEQRREEILDAAIAEFARFGLYGTSVYAIAEGTGISQPYIFRLFGTKKELFIASAQRVCRRIERTFAAAAKREPAHALKAMGAAYGELMKSRAELSVLLQAFAAAEDTEVREAVSRCYRDLWDFVQRTSGEPREKVRDFFAYGMGMTVGAALGIEDLMC